MAIPLGANLWIPQAPKGGIASGLVHYWKMDETSGSRVDTLGGTSWTVGGGTPGSGTGMLNNAASVSLGNYLTIASSNFFPGTTWTLSFWINPSAFTAFPPNAVPILVSDTGTGGIDLSKDDGTTTIRFTAYSGGGSVALTGNPLSTGAWHNVILWKSGATIGGMSIDGVDTGNLSTTFVVGGFVLLGFPSFTSVSALVDEMGMWNRVLNASERAALYNSGTGLFYPF